MLQVMGDELCSQRQDLYHVVVQHGDILDQHRDGTLDLLRADGVILSMGRGGRGGGGGVGVDVPHEMSLEEQQEFSGGGLTINQFRIASLTESRHLYSKGTAKRVRANIGPQ